MFKILHSVTEVTILLSFWSLQYMQTQGVKFSLSDDSHGPADVGMHYGKVHAYLKEFGIDTLYYPAVNREGVLEVRAWENVLSSASWNRLL